MYVHYYKIGIFLNAIITKYALQYLNIYYCTSIKLVSLFFFCHPFNLFYTNHKYISTKQTEQNQQLIKYQIRNTSLSKNNVSYINCTTFCYFSTLLHVFIYLLLLGDKEIRWSKNTRFPTLY